MRLELLFSPIGKGPRPSSGSGPTVTASPNVSPTRSEGSHISRALGRTMQMSCCLVSAPVGSFSLWSLTLHDKKVAAFDAVESLTEPKAEISPNGRWVAYNEWKKETSTVYVRPFPATAVMFRIATGVNPFWGPEGKSLYYAEAPGATAFSVVNVTTEPTFSVSAPLNTEATACRRRTECATDLRYRA
jgi:hypothetical protein